jgi:hypothetical protein
MNIAVILAMAFAIAIGVALIAGRRLRVVAKLKPPNSSSLGLLLPHLRQS